MSTIKSVTIVGASGNVGQAVLPFFIEAGFDVTVICRPTSESTFPPAVNVIKSDYTLDSLISALTGQDAVICALGPMSLQVETVVIDAAATARVKWFIPSEFGHNTADERVLKVLPLLKTKTDILAQLGSKAQDGMNWVGIVTGLFFDWGLARGFLEFDIPKHTARIWDDGNTTYLTTNISDIGIALVKLLSDPAVQNEVKNKHVHISSFEVSQNQILQELERVTGETFKVESISSQEIRRHATERLAKGDLSSIGPLLQYIAWGEERLSQWTAEAKYGNALLLPQHRETFEQTVERVSVGVLNGKDGKAAL
ncbi:hypothetical protein LCI18_008222 [Fusarium solani-melongenae]|uniref:Uncharacterized protein n=1 Tax=Fusarium solani subsp. cucurbitae TaxID=2747967 RepID=A0ACD3Z830_FUSSC|nr:hypothetical protein LCI18_008222 [Fusarium solani-melongenae]